MSHALYRKYRSKSLDEIVGQSHVTTILARALAAGRVAHAYLLTGPRGIGKTSIARILAHEINGLPYANDETHLDIIEIDAASNNGVEDVRDLRDKVQVAPVAAKKKVYIIDEVHMLSKAAFNALLKTLEEPPEHAVFILATTDVEKLPATIISRTQRFSLRAITTNDAIKHLSHIAKSEGIAIDDDALELIAQRGDGSFRDSISLLDQLQHLTDGAPITRELIEQSLGLAPNQLVSELIDAHEARDLARIITLIDQSEKSGASASVLAAQLVDTVRRSVASRPRLIPLLDQLLDVPKSSQPHIKLLTVLAKDATPKQQNAALASPTASVSASLEDLSALATTPVRVAPAAPQAQTAKSAPAPAKNKPEKAPSTPAPAPEHEITPLGAFDWDAVLAHLKEHSVATYSVVSKCTPEVKGDTLILYTMNPFYKKKLDDAKYRFTLVDSLKATGAGTPLVDTIGTPPPPKDETAAAVAAIMGGGEEVSVD
ncbi:MAG TPA: DNA polymerase III subunit gamma/tau [Candidatus Saccharimonadales bacterium]|nr:DNA polymerase III subunit gamma/tau [Candidatus Saccharimonadales bacterium]